MASTWPPSKESELLPWAQNYSTKITAAPTTYGLLAADATALSGVLLSFSNALTAATTPATRTAVTVTAKDVAKAALVAEIRALAKRIQATLSVTAEQKVSLGLPVHKDTQTPIPAPATKPVVTLAGISSGRELKIRLVDETTPETRAKPFGVEGAEVYSYVPTASETPPTDLEKWRFEGIAKRSTFDVDFNAEDVGKTAYVRALWFNPRGEPGPVSNPVTATIAA